MSVELKTYREGDAHMRLSLTVSKLEALQMSHLLREFGWDQEAEALHAWAESEDA